MARKRTGQLILRASGWYARLWTIVDGEPIRVMRALGTHNKLVAKRKLARLLAAENASTVDAKRGETFGEATERVYAQRQAEGAGGAAYDLTALRRYALPLIGNMLASEVRPPDINTVLDASKAEGLAQRSVSHMRNRMSVVFRQLRREGLPVNPVADSSLPKFQRSAARERAVLVDSELAIYLAWEHPVERHRGPALERQVMACVARLFGGLRTGDLHAMRYEALDVEHGAFAWGYAPRRKTKQPQLLEVPELLRPFLRDWWERAGRPTSGLLFPVRRPGKRGDRVGQQRGRGMSHAAAFRRDLLSAFKVAHAAKVVGVPGSDSRRWAQLFTKTEYTLPVDFHSWRRAYAQALADSDVSAQQAMALTGHSSMAVHAGYLQNAGKMRRLPSGALPQITFVERAHVRGRGTETPGEMNVRATGGDVVSRGNHVIDALRNRMSGVRIPLGVPENKGSGENARDEKVLALPERGSVSALPAQAHVGMRDLLAAIDDAALAGDLHRVRALVAAAVEALEQSSDAPNGARVDGQEPRS